MNPKIRIFTYHNIKNPGASLFAYSLINLLKDGFQSNNVKIIDYKSPKMELYENLKRFKIYPKIPFFYNQRHMTWEKFLKKNYIFDKDLSIFSPTKDYQSYYDGYRNIIVVGMDVWCIINGTERPKFPNIFWLPEKMVANKIAYGVSAYHSDVKLIQKNSKEITQYLNGFDVIGARDQFTYQLIKQYRTRTDGIVAKIPDPTFTFKIKPTGVGGKLKSLGINLNQPIVGLLLFGDKNISQQICNYYSKKGYQTVALSMYNSIADYNLGHLLNPFEWAEVFRFLTVCVTDRFHGTVFCLKNNTPFISVQKEKDIPLSQSKVYDLLTSFELLDCFSNPHSYDFSIENFINQLEEVEKGWDNHYGNRISEKIIDAQNELHKFNELIKIQEN